MVNYCDGCSFCGGVGGTVVGGGSVDSLNWQTMPYHTKPYPTLPYPTVPYCTVLYHTVPYSTIPYQTVDQLVSARRAVRRPRKTAVGSKQAESNDARRSSSLARLFHQKLWLRPTVMIERSSKGAQGTPSTW